MLVCQQCGYAMYRSSGGRSHRKLDYYRCIGSDGYRRLNGPLCTNRPVRQDHLDEIVWEQVIRLLEDGTLIQSEIDRRREVAQNTDPRRQRGQGLRREQARLENHIERLVSAYQEGLVTFEQLRQRMPDLQKRSQAVESELHSLEMAVVDETRYLKLAENLAGFRTKLRVRAQTLDVRERQQLLRLLVKEILVGADALTIRHSIRIPPSGPGSDGPPSPDAGPSEPAMTLGYRLRTRSRLTAACERLLALRALTPVTRGGSRMRRSARTDLCGVVSRMRDKRNAVPEMKEDPSEPAYRRGLQTAISCCRPMAVVVNVMEKA
jgi:site-specific DNA recombinase